MALRVSHPPTHSTFFHTKSDILYPARPLVPHAGLVEAEEDVAVHGSASQAARGLRALIAAGVCHRQVRAGWPGKGEQACRVRQSLRAFVAAGSGRCVAERRQGLVDLPPKHCLRVAEGLVGSCWAQCHVLTSLNCC